MIKSKSKTMLRHGTADKLVFCHEAIHLRSKLLSAGFKPEVEAWDEASDSDSADSGDEEDFSKYAR